MMRYIGVAAVFLSMLFAINVCAFDELPSLIVVSDDAALTPDDIEKVGLRYSKKNSIMILNVEFSDNGKKKLEKMLKSNKGKKIGLIDSQKVMMKPVFINTETVLNHLDIYIADEKVALNLLKKLSK